MRLVPNGYHQIFGYDFPARYFCPLMAVRTGVFRSVEMVALQASPPVGYTHTLKLYGNRMTVGALNRSMSSMIQNRFMARDALQLAVFRMGKPRVIRRFESRPYRGIANVRTLLG
ncbi:MAG: hypothetical protein OEZ54_07915 [Gemmatimonadota bacterium]|nr:hypothetical protein [Gemmatimonadota bacterium]